MSVRTIAPGNSWQPTRDPIPPNLEPFEVAPRQTFRERGALCLRIGCVSPGASPSPA